MKLRYLPVPFFAMSLGLAACGDDPKNPFPTISCEKVETENCIEIAPGDSQALLLAVNDDLKPNTTIVLGAGKFVLDNEVTILNVAGISLIGQGIDKSVLDFGTMTAQGNGVFASNTHNILVQDFTVVDAVKDGIRIENSDGVIFRRIRATWTTPGDATNGAYGIYPVKVKNVLVEDSFAENASDAGLYVGQCQYAIVRNNTVKGNVAGLEIENTQYADVYGNLAEDNTGGIVVFDMPGNPIVGRDVRVHDNIIRRNNRPNFAPTGVVKEIPAGTGTFAMASRRVEITDNVYENNQTVDIAIISGFLVEPNLVDWSLSTATLLGDWEDLGLGVGYSYQCETELNEDDEEVCVEDENGDIVYVLDGDDNRIIIEDPTKINNGPSTEIVIANNSHTGSGTKVDHSVELGQGLLIAFPGQTVPSVLYEVLGESSFDTEDAAGNSNDNRVCVGDNTGGNFAVVALSVPVAEIASFTFGESLEEFACNSLTDGPIGEITLEGGAR